MALSIDKFDVCPELFLKVLPIPLNTFAVDPRPLLTFNSKLCSANTI